MCHGMAGSTGLRGIPEPTICGIWSYKILCYCWGDVPRWHFNSQVWFAAKLFVWERNRNEILLLVQGWGAAIHVPSIRSAVLGTYARHCKQYQGGQVIIPPRVCNSTPCMFSLVQSFSRKKMNPWAAQPLCWGSMLRDSLDWWKSMVGTWILEAPNIARTTEADQLFDEVASCAYGWWLICFDSYSTNSQTSSSKIVSKERGRSLVDLWCWQTLFATVPEEYQVVTEAHQFSANHIVKELSH